MRRAQANARVGSAYATSATSSAGIVSSEATDQRNALRDDALARSTLPARNCDETRHAWMDGWLPRYRAGRRSQ
jgi:hypothetical protein